MRSLSKMFSFVLIGTLLCFGLTACDMGLPNTKQDNIIYSQVDNKLYFKGELYSLYPSFNNTTFYFPILSNKKINSIENVTFFNGNSEIDGIIVVIPDTRDDKVINAGLYLNVVEFQLNIQNIDSMHVSKISLVADDIQVFYNVDIVFHYYYLNPEYALSTQGDMLLEYDKSSFTLVYGYASLVNTSKFNHIESIVNGIEVEQLFIADGENKKDIEGELPWSFSEISNNNTNNYAYKNNVLKIKCDYSQIKQEVLFFKDVFRANLTIGEEEVNIMLPGVASNSLIELYVTLCEELEI